MNEKEKTINWLYTALGGFSSSLSVAAIYKSRRAGKDVDVPIIGNPSLTETLVFGVCVIGLVTLICTLLCLWFQKGKERWNHRWELLPAAFDRPFTQGLAFLRVVTFLLFVVWPTYATGALARQLLTECHIFHRKTKVVLKGSEMFTFPEKFWDASIWRWRAPPDTDLLSAFPGIQPLAYCLLLVGCGSLIFVIWIRMHLMTRRSRLSNHQPNKAPEPTARSVTSPAAREPRQT